MVLGSLFDLLIKMGWGFAHEAKSCLLIWFHVRKLLFTRRSFRSLLTPLTYVHVGIKVTKTAFRRCLLNLWQVSRALGRAALFWFCARAKGICDHPQINLFFDGGGGVGFLNRTVSESALAPTLCLISWVTTKILSPTTLRAGRIDSHGQAIDHELAESQSHH